MIDESDSAEFVYCALTLNVLIKKTPFLSNFPKLLIGFLFIFTPMKHKQFIYNQSSCEHLYYNCKIVRYFNTHFILFLKFYKIKIYFWLIIF